MRRWLVPIAVAAVAFGSPPRLGGAAAQPAEPLTAAPFRSGTSGDLARLCAADAADPAQLLALGYCHGFIAAIGQAHAALTRADGPFRPFFCLPQPAPTLAQVGTRFADWARANPQHAAEPAVDGLLRFGGSAYPCPPEPASAEARGRRSR